MKTTLITQLDLAATLVPQGFVCVKSAAFAPVMWIPAPVMLRAAVPVFESVVVCAVEEVPEICDAKVSEVGLRLATGVGVVAGLMVSLNVPVLVEKLASPE